MQKKKPLDTLATFSKNSGQNQMNWNLLGENVKVDSLLQAGLDDKTILKKMGLKETDGYFKKRLFAQVLKFHKNRSGGSVLKAFYDSLPIAMFFLLPLFALILKLLYFNKGSYAHHLVFSFYFFSFQFIVFTFLALGHLIWTNFPDWVTTLVIFSVFFYLMIALRNFYGQSWFISYIKASLSTFVFGMFMTAVSMFLVAFAVLSF